MKKQIPLPPIILSVFVCSLLYWSYLAFHTRMDIAWDSLIYEQLGQLIQKHGFVPSYFEGGPNREPLYPLLIALAMTLGQWTSIAYTNIMALFGVLTLIVSQALIYMILKRLNVRTAVCVLVLSYFAISPSIVNSAFSLYSEMAAYPFILGIILISFYAWEAISKNQWRTATSWGSLLGISFVGATLVKGVFECIFPFYLVIFLLGLAIKHRQRLKTMPLIACVLGALILFYTPIITYKSLNQRYNGNFSITNRWSWMLYGNTAQRLEPLTSRRILTAMAYTPGEGLCNSLFNPTECGYWAFNTSDDLGMKKNAELKKEYPSQQATNQALIHLSIQRIWHNPGQYIFVGIIESFRIFFWESTQIGFVQYPSWLTHLYNIKLLNNGLRFGMALLTIFSVFWIWWRCLCQRAEPLVLALGSLTFLFFFCFSFVSILTRYALPIAPLYLICIGYWLHFLVSQKKKV